MQPVTRYTDLLIGELRQMQRKEIVMLGIVGVPVVTQRAADSPFEAQAGGVAELVYRDWTDADILPSDASNGITAADKQFDFGIGPGCSAAGPTNESQGIPPSRLRTVCEALDVGTERGDLRCCLESVCGDDYDGATQCLLGLIDNVTAD